MKRKRAQDLRGGTSLTFTAPLLGARYILLPVTLTVAYEREENHHLTIINEETEHEKSQVGNQVCLPPQLSPQSLMLLSI